MDTTRTNQTSGRLLAELDQLMAAATTNYYQRIALADQLLQDKQWILSEFAGNAHRAGAVLEKRYFHDLSGTLSIWNLLLIYRRFPTEEEWSKCNYNLRLLYELCKPPAQKRTPQQRISKVAFEKAIQEAKEAQAAYRKLQKDYQQLEKENQQLRRQLDELKGMKR